MHRLSSNLSRESVTGVQYTATMRNMLVNMKLGTELCVEGQDGSIFIGDMEVDHDDLESYVYSLWNIMQDIRVRGGVSKTLEQVLLRNIEESNIACPSFMAVFDEIYHKSIFNPSCAREVDLFPHPPMSKLPAFSSPLISPEIVKILVEVSERYPQFNESYLLFLSSVGGVSIANCTGANSRAYRRQLDKLKSNIVTPKSDYSEYLYLACCNLWHRWGIKYNPIKWEVVDSKLMKLLNKDSAVGYVVGEFLEFVDGSFKPTTSVKKKHIAKQAISDFHGWLDSLDEWLDSGSSSPPPQCVFKDNEMVKWEILWNFDMLDRKMTSEEIVKLREKVRLFYMSSVSDFILESLCYKPMSEGIRFYESAIGVRVEAGGLQCIWNILNGDYTKEQRRIIDKWKEMGIDLTDKKFGQGDWSRYDQTLLAVVLLFVSIFSKPFFEHDMSDEKFNLIFAEFCRSIVQKVMHIYAYGTWEVFGCMFSGKYVTSIGDTIYQMILKLVYMMKLKERYPDDELLKDIIVYGFIVAFFYGDDHLFSWPAIMDERAYFLYDDSANFLDDFTLWCCREFGMIRKESEFKVFDELYSRHYFRAIDGVFVEQFTEDTYCGPVFLKNAVSQTYVYSEDSQEYAFIGCLPYRETRDFCGKFGFTLSSTNNIKKYVMNLRSQARLASGNLEAYSMCKVLHDKVMERVEEPSLDEWEAYMSSAKENSVRRASVKGPFPSYDEIYAKQIEGQRGSGFSPKDFYGNVSIQSALYEANGKGNKQLKPDSYVGDLYSVFYNSTVTDDFQEMF